MRTFVVFVLGIILFSPISAQSQYSSWSNPDAQPSQQTQTTTPTSNALQEFTNKLKALIAKAKKAKAADPTFLRDLSDLANGFDRPWKKLLFSDDFRDNNYTASPAWTVSKGRYFIEKGWGLRNKVEQATTTQKSSGNDALASVLGQILNQNKTTTKTQSKNQPTSIHSNFRLTNAFSIDLEFSSWMNEGRFSVKAYQGQIQEGVRASGYRLVYAPGARIELIRRTRSSSGVIETTQAAYKLEDKKTHRIIWTRFSDGTMVVSIDGKQAIKTLDRSFRDPFNGVQLSSRGGDFIVKKITVLGTP